ncbi:MAG: hypothetical protein A2X45_01600 [Lentisphaerae bacterium GWF2_50_93]|nr:MAG: hypothetical protein A2X45_01600 [Lentisphaerae bacterium GWF2_50_93]
MRYITLGFPGNSDSELKADEIAARISKLKADQRKVKDFLSQIDEFNTKFARTEYIATKQAELSV